MNIFNCGIFPSDNEYINNNIEIYIGSFFLNYLPKDFKKISIYVILDGNCQVYYQDSVYKLEARDIFISASHRFYFFNTISNDCLFLKIEFFEDAENNIHLNLYDQIIYKAFKNTRMLENLYSIMYLCKSNYYGKLCENMSIVYYTDKLIKEIYSQARVKNDNRGQEKNNKNVQDVWDIFYEIMEKPYEDHRLSTKEDIYNISYSQLSKNFKEITGIKYNNFITYMRLDRAIEMLYSTDKSVLDISLEVGFNSSKAFHESFRKFTGTTPYKYKRQIIEISNNDFKYKNIGDYYSNPEVVNMIDEYSIDFYSGSGRKINIYNFNYYNSSNFSEMDLDTIIDNLIIAVDSSVKLNTSFLDAISKDLSLNRLKIEISINDDFEPFVYYEEEAYKLSVNDIIRYASLLIKYNKKPLITVILDRGLFNRGDRIVAILSIYFCLLTDILGLVELQNWTFEFKIELDCVINERCMEGFMIFLSTIRQDVCAKYGLDKIGINVGDLDRYNTDSCFKNFVDRLCKEDYLDHLSFNIVNSYFDGEDILDYIYLEKLLDKSQKTITSIRRKCNNDKQIYVSFMDIRENYRLLPKKYLEGIKAINLLVRLHWLIRAGVSIIKVGKDCLFNLYYSQQKDIKRLSIGDISHGVLKYYLKSDHYFRDSTYYILKFISKLYENVRSYDDRFLISSNGTDYKAIIHLSCSDNYRSMLDAKNEDDCANNLVKVKIPINSGVYKLRVYTINSNFGNVYTEMDKIGDPCNFDSNEMEYLERINMPKLEVEEIHVDKFFQKDFKFEPFEIKLLTFTRIK